MPDKWVLKCFLYHPPTHPLLGACELISQQEKIKVGEPQVLVFWKNKQTEKRIMKIPVSKEQKQWNW